MVKKLLLIILYLLFFVFVLNACTVKNEKSKRINNLLDVNGDNVSELLFWNFFSQDAFFESITIQGLNYHTTSLGSLGDIPVYGDFTGDGNTDYGVFQHLQDINKWQLVDGLTKVSFSERFGQPGDLPIPSDFDGDGKTDFVVYRPSNSGFYGTLSNKNKILEVHFGLPGDIPVPKDYDGDGKADIATYRMQSGIWLIRSSKNGTVKKVSLGGFDYLPVPGDYDGDGKADFAVWDYKTNDCKIVFSSVFKSYFKKPDLSYIKQKLENKRCFPVSSDFDGDGKCELAFWDYKNQIVHIFKIIGGRINHQESHITVKEYSEPVAYYLLKKFLHREIKINPSTIVYNGFSKLVLGKNGKFSCQGCSVPDELKLDSKEDISYFLSDFDGDFMPDPCIWSGTSRAFLISSSEDKSQILASPVSGGDLPFVGHFNYDEAADVGVFMLSDNSFYIKYLGSDFNDKDVEKVTINIPKTNKLIVDDFDGDFVDDLGSYNFDNKTFVVRFSNTGLVKEIPFIVNPDELIASDFDGDGKSDLGVVDIVNKIFTYLSSCQNKLVSVALDDRISGQPLACDIDLDFMSDLLFYNSGTSVFGVLRSSDAYRYGEVSFGETGSKPVNLIR